MNKKDRIAYLTINRPEALNALDYTTWQEIFATIEDFRRDDGTWVLIITKSPFLCQQSYKA